MKALETILEFLKFVVIAATIVAIVYFISGCVRDSLIAEQELKAKPTDVNLNLRLNGTQSK